MQTAAHEPFVWGIIISNSWHYVPTCSINSGMIPTNEHQTVLRNQTVPLWYKFCANMKHQLFQNLKFCLIFRIELYRAVMYSCHALSWIPWANIQSQFAFVPPFWLCNHLLCFLINWSHFPFLCIVCLCHCEASLTSIHLKPCHLPMKCRYLILSCCSSIKNTLVVI